ncbi:MAG: 50S ribosomal protein L19 [Candidatus Calescibacterium sp.]|nr:50S ribosomal protein L19 [Candidatus Calescibacterium sp.]MCX7972177.1 50S ribosomal protein L19 [bacterium]MDW8194867.1 50S ribosomal protein L19 [Candidatus Calescibacterium sp.]
MKTVRVKNSSIILREIHKKYLPSEKEINFKVGDYVKVHQKIVEGDKTRIQVFEGQVIEIHGPKENIFFTVRKEVQGVGVEKTFRLNSPIIEKVEFVRHPLKKPRRKKLFYLRGG